VVNLFALGDFFCNGDAAKQIENLFAVLFCDDNWLYLLDRCLKALRECLLTFAQVSIRRLCLHAVVQSYDMEHQSASIDALGHRLSILAMIPLSQRNSVGNSTILMRGDGLPSD
jgi:hypothetical protein